MKISKTAVLTVGSALMIAGLGLMFVSAADKNLYVDPNNAIQHFEKVRIVPTESGDNSMADIVKKGNLFGIETDYNFALSRSGTDANQISGNTMGSSILGGIVNKILGGIYNGILGGKNNKITTGNNNGILGGENNEIGGNYSVIFGGKGNEIGGSGSYSAIVGGSGNKINGSYSVVVGRNNNTAKGYNSVAMGSGSKLNATSSFLWTDGIYSGNFTTNHVFAVLGDKGMVINATGAHDLAQLTISGVLVVYDDKNAPKCTPETKGVLKVVTGDNSTTNQECFCSCDGSGRNVLHEGSNCVELCKDDDLKESPQCGNVVEDCNNPYRYTGGSEGACVKGQLIRGTGAFFVSSTREGTGLINYINRSCQVAGEITGCQKKLEGDSCPNRFTDYECLGEKEEHWLTKDNIKPRDSATHWEYSVTGYDNNEPCKYICDQWSHWDSRQEKCMPNACGDLSDLHAHMNNSYLPTEDGKEPEYAPRSSEACTYDCDDGYGYDSSQELCRALECEDFNIPNATPNSRNGYPTEFDQAYEYEEPSSYNNPCTFHCDSGFGYKEGEGCKQLACVGDLPDNTELVHPTLKPTDPDTRIFYNPDSELPCAYKCKKNYIRSGDNCVLDLKNCSVGLRESTTSTSAKTLSSSYTVSNLGSSNDWECEYTGDVTVKLFADVCDDKVQSFNTKLGSVTMNQGYKFKGWYVDGVLKSSDLNNGLNLNCGDMADLKWDCDEENDYERYNGHCVKKTGGECVGPVPDHAVLVGKGEERVPGTIGRKIYPDKSLASGEYCAYVCTGTNSEGKKYEPVEVDGVFQCAVCDDYDPTNYKCNGTMEVTCNGIEQSVLVELSSDNYICRNIGNCFYDNKLLVQVPSNGKAYGSPTWKYSDYMPVLGGQDKSWKCTDGTPTPNQCEYQCANSYACQDGVCKAYTCPPKNGDNLYPDAYSTEAFAITQVITRVKGVGGNRWIYDPDDSKTEDGCYYKCDPSNSFYGLYKYYSQPKYRSTGCILRKCPVWPSSVSSEGVLTGGKPQWRYGSNAQGEEVTSDDWQYYEGSLPSGYGCFYTCDTENGYSPVRNSNGIVECTKNHCPAVTKKNLYSYYSNISDYSSYLYALSTGVITRMKGAGGNKWIYDPNQSKTEDGCYYKCDPSNSFYGVYKNNYSEYWSEYWVTGCIERKCPDLPSILGVMQSNGLLITDPNPQWRYNSNAQGEIVSSDNRQFYSGQKPSGYGCYYRCADDATGILVDVGDGVMMTGCTRDVCPLVTSKTIYPDAFYTYAFSDNVIVRKEGSGGNKWIYDPDDSKTEDGCYYKCDPSNSFYGLYKYDSDNPKYRGTGCLTRVCPSRPLSSYDGVITKKNPQWHYNSNAQGEIVSSDNRQYYEGSVPSGYGCYYTCDTSNKYYPGPANDQGIRVCQKYEGDWCDDHPCGQDECPNPPCDTGPGNGTGGNNQSTPCDNICIDCNYITKYLACRPDGLPPEGVEDCSAYNDKLLAGTSWNFVHVPYGNTTIGTCMYCPVGTWDSESATCK